MSVGLIALLDDVAGIAKVAAASIDDIGSLTAKAGAKSAGVVIDDAAVTPRYLVGFAAARELPIVRKIATGSLRNKLLYLLPAALVLSAFAPWAITPLLMLGGAFLCYEGAEKVHELVFPHAAHGPEPAALAEDPRTLEDAKVRGAIQTDFILSAEIMAIALASLPELAIWTQAIVLALVGASITVVVYGAVALIVKADDLGVALAANTSRGIGGRLARALGRGLVVGMPGFLKLLALVGTAAMIWVGGGIILHGLESFGLGGPAHWIEGVAEAAAHALPAAGGFLHWLVAAAFAGVFGLLLGSLLIPLTNHVLAPAARTLRGRRSASH